MEYNRRGEAPSDAISDNLANLNAQITKLRRGIARLIDSYAEGLPIENGIRATDYSNQAPDSHFGSTDETS